MSSLAVRCYRDRRALVTATKNPPVNGWELAVLLGIVDPEDLQRRQAEADAAEGRALVRYAQR